MAGVSYAAGIVYPIVQLNAYKTNGEKAGSVRSCKFFQALVFFYRFHSGECQNVTVSSAITKGRLTKERMEWGILVEQGTGNVI